MPGDAEDLQEWQQATPTKHQPEPLRMMMMFMMMLTMTMMMLVVNDGGEDDHDDNDASVSNKRSALDFP